MRTFDEAKADMDAAGLTFGQNWSFALRSRYDNGAEYEIYRFAQDGGRECVEVVEVTY